MVERFNRRLGEHLNRMPQNRAAHHRGFRDHAERDAYLHTFIADYNRTRLRCLNYHAPAEELANLTGQNTKAGVHSSTAREAERVGPGLRRDDRERVRPSLIPPLLLSGGGSK